MYVYMYVCTYVCMHRLKNACVRALYSTCVYTPVVACLPSVAGPVQDEATVPQRHPKNPLAVWVCRHGKDSVQLAGAHNAALWWTIIPFLEGHCCTI